MKNEPNMYCMWINFNLILEGCLNKLLCPKKNLGVPLVNPMKVDGKAIDNHFFIIVNDGYILVNRILIYLKVWNSWCCHCR